MQRWGQVLERMQPPPTPQELEEAGRNAAWPTPGLQTPGLQNHQRTNSYCFNPPRGYGSQSESHRRCMKNWTELSLEPWDQRSRVLFSITCESSIKTSTSFFLSLRMTCLWDDGENRVRAAGANPLGWSRQGQEHRFCQQSWGWLCPGRPSLMARGHLGHLLSSSAAPAHSREGSTPSPEGSVMTALGADCSPSHCVVHEPQDPIPSQLSGGSWAWQLPSP